MDPDLDGFVVTYQQVSANGQLFRKIAEETKSMVLFDEFHHMGRNLSWRLHVHKPLNMRTLR